MSTENKIENRIDSINMIRRIHINNRQPNEELDIVLFLEENPNYNRVRNKLPIDIWSKPALDRIQNLNQQNVQKILEVFLMQPSLYFISEHYVILCYSIQLSRILKFRFFKHKGIQFTSYFV